MKVYLFSKWGIITTGIFLFGSLIPCLMCAFLPTDATINNNPDSNVGINNTNAVKDSLVISVAMTVVITVVVDVNIK